MLKWGTCPDCGQRLELEFQERIPPHEVRTGISFGDTPAMARCLGTGKWPSEKTS